MALRGTNSNTGADVDEWMCAVPANVMMTMEAAAQARQAGAATESFRNEVVRRADATAIVPGPALRQPRPPLLESTHD